VTSLTPPYPLLPFAFLRRSDILLPFFLSSFLLSTSCNILVGCINSKEDEGLRDSQSSALLVPLPRTSTKSPLSDKEIESRIECPHEAIVMKIGPVVYNVAYVCQRGYYPDCTIAFPSRSSWFSFPFSSRQGESRYFFCDSEI
jgi:hypothetical protein